MESSEILCRLCIKFSDLPPFCAALSYLCHLLVSLWFCPDLADFILLENKLRPNLHLVVNFFWSRSRQNINFLRSPSKRADSPAPTIIAKSPLQLWAIIPRVISRPDLRICVWNRSERCKSRVSSSSSCETMFARAASWLQIRLQHFYFSKIYPTHMRLLLSGLFGI